MTEDQKNTQSKSRYLRDHERLEKSLYKTPEERKAKLEDAYLNYVSRNESKLGSHRKNKTLE